MAVLFRAEKNDGDILERHALPQPAQHFQVAAIHIQAVEDHARGQGAEVTLHELPMLSALGLSMTGPRDGGFGALDDRTYQICGSGDLICAAPESAFSVGNLPATLETLLGSTKGPVHALYNTPQFWTLDGKTTTQWTLDWARNLLQNAPHPKHS